MIIILIYVIFMIIIVTLGVNPLIVHSLTNQNKIQLEIKFYIILKKIK
jgi:hypothetical protein